MSSLLPHWQSVLWAPWVVRPKPVWLGDNYGLTGLMEAGIDYLTSGSPLDLLKVAVQGMRCG